MPAWEERWRTLRAEWVIVAAHRRHRPWTGGTVLHQAPADGGDFHFFIAFHPPLRQPQLLERLAGPGIGGSNFLSDTSPELKALAATHYAAAKA